MFFATLRQVVELFEGSGLEELLKGGLQACEGLFLLGVPGGRGPRQRRRWRRTWAKRAWKGWGGGRAQVATLNVGDGSLPETLSTCRFAQRVANAWRLRGTAFPCHGGADLREGERAARSSTAHRTAATGHDAGTSERTEEQCRMSVLVSQDVLNTYIVATLLKIA